MTEQRTAQFSPDGRYRYSLTRDWSDELTTDNVDNGTVLFVMLNPSTANQMINDPTVNRCCSFARTWGFPRLIVVNVFAYRATKPAVLAAQHRGGVDVVGPDNARHLADAMKGADLVIAAWGASYPHSLRSHVTQARQYLAMAGAKCLSYTATGEPRHPLYVPRGTPLVPLVAR